MQFNYDNSYEYCSWTEAEVADLPIPTSDWTTADVKALVLHFYGDPGNSATVNDKMYVALDDTLNGDPVKMDLWEKIASYGVDALIAIACIFTFPLTIGMSLTGLIASITASILVDCTWEDTYDNWSNGY